MQKLGYILDKHLGRILLLISATTVLGISFLLLACKGTVVQNWFPCASGLSSWLQVLIEAMGFLGATVALIASWFASNREPALRLYFDKGGRTASRDELEIDIGDPHREYSHLELFVKNDSRIPARFIKFQIELVMLTKWPEGLAVRSLGPINLTIEWHDILPGRTADEISKQYQKMEAKTLEEQVVVYELDTPKRVAKFRFFIEGDMTDRLASERYNLNHFKYVLRARAFCLGQTEVSEVEIPITLDSHA